jgi:hypothetical protein
MAAARRRPAQASAQPKSGPEDADGDCALPSACRTVLAEERASWACGGRRSEASAWVAVGARPGTWCVAWASATPRAGTASGAVLAGAREGARPTPCTLRGVSAERGAPPCAGPVSGARPGAGAGRGTPPGTGTGRGPRPGAGAGRGAPRGAVTGRGARPGAGPGAPRGAGTGRGARLGPGARRGARPGAGRGAPPGAGAGRGAPLGVGAGAGLGAGAGAGAGAGCGASLGGGAVGGGRSESGSRYACRVPASRTPKCRWAWAAERVPLVPTAPTRSPATTRAPARTASAERCRYEVSKPSPVRTLTVSPDEPAVPANSTSPPSAAITGVPTAAAMSIPRCCPAA